MVMKENFNRYLDHCVENVLRDQKDFTTELKLEYVKFINLCKRVAEYDPELALEVFKGTIWFSYTNAMDLIQKR